MQSYVSFPQALETADEFFDEFVARLTDYLFQNTTYSYRHDAIKNLIKIIFSYYGEAGEACALNEIKNVFETLAAKPHTHFLRPSCSGPNPTVYEAVRRFKIIGERIKALFADTAGYQTGLFLPDFLPVVGGYNFLSTGKSSLKTLVDEMMLQYPKVLKKLETKAADASTYLLLIQQDTPSKLLTDVDFNALLSSLPLILGYLYHIDKSQQHLQINHQNYNLIVRHTMEDTKEYLQRGGVGEGITCFGIAIELDQENVKQKSLGFPGEQIELYQSVTRVDMWNYSSSSRKGPGFVCKPIQYKNYAFSLIELPLALSAQGLKK